MNLFLKATAVLEGFTGLALIVAPKLIIQLLFLSSMEESGGIFISRVAGVALLTIALLCWLTKETFPLLVKLLLFYNIAVAVMGFYSLSDSGLKGMGVAAIISFHTFFAIWGIAVLKKASKKLIN